MRPMGAHPPPVFPAREPHPVSSAYDVVIGHGRCYGGKTMCNSNSCGNSVGCCLLNNFADAINNLFSTEPYCGCHGNHGCGCNGGRPVNLFTDGFVSGVNAANTVYGCGCNGNNGCGCSGNGGNGGFGIQAVSNFFGPVSSGCGCGCGSNADLSSYTACNNQCFDAYYAQQYGLYPFNTSSNGICSCCNG